MGIHIRSTNGYGGRGGMGGLNWPIFSTLKSGKYVLRSIYDLMFCSKVKAYLVYILVSARILTFWKISAFFPGKILISRVTLK